MLKIFGYGFYAWGISGITYFWLTPNSQVWIGAIAGLSLGLGAGILGRSD